MRRLKLAAVLTSGLLSTMPAWAGEITMYVPWVEENMTALQNELDRRGMDIKVNYYRSASVELDMLFTNEQRGGLHKADYIMMDPDYLETYKKAGYLHKHQPNGLNEFPASAVDPDGYWFALEYSPMFLVYNTNLLKGDQVPTSWRDLADPRFKNLIGMADPRTSTAIQFPLTYWTAVLGERIGEPEYGWPFLEEMAKNNPQLSTGHSQLTDMVMTGEIAVAPLMLAPVLPAMKNGEPLGIALPKEGAPLQIVAGSVVESAPNREDAIKLHDFFASLEGQTFIQSLGIPVAHKGVNQVLPDGTDLSGVEGHRLEISEEQRRNNVERFVEIMGL